MIELSSFTSIFELSVAFNFLNVAHDVFGSYVFKYLTAWYYSLKSQFEKKIAVKHEKILSDYTKLNNTRNITSEIQNSIKSLSKDFTKLNFQLEADNGGRFNQTFKGIYLFVGLYSFYLLILSGTINTSGTYFPSLEILNWLVFSVLIIFLTLSISKNNFQLSQKYFVYIFISTIIISNTNYCLSKDFHFNFLTPSSSNFDVFFCIFISISSFILHFLGFLIEIGKYKYKQYKFIKKVDLLDKLIDNQNNNQDETDPEVYLKQIIDQLNNNRD